MKRSDTFLKIAIKEENYSKKNFNLLSSIKIFESILVVFLIKLGGQIMVLMYM